MVSMEGVWLSIEDDDRDICNEEYAYDSDVIDSETEAELYSSIHYEENLNFCEPNSENIYITKPVCHNSDSDVLNLRTDIFSLVNNSENNAPIVNTFESVSSAHSSVETITVRNVSNDQLKNPSPSKKPKLDFGQEVLSANLCSNDSKDSESNESSKHKLLNQVRKCTNDFNAHLKRSSPKVKIPGHDSTIVVDSSDSDSFIWTENDSQDKFNFQTNLLNDAHADVICINSSSESNSEEPVPLSTMKRKSNLKNQSMPNIKIGEKREDLWHINDEDLYRRRKFSRRYHETVDVTCSNCNKKGHNFRNCPVPKIIKCFICGGSHLGSRCMNRICSNCYKYGHERKHCQRRPNQFYCRLCKFKGHTSEDCPDLWRRYHLTTESRKIVQGKQIKQNTNLYCWNCGDSGHFGADCYSGSFKSLITWPCVVSYQSPEEHLRKRLDIINTQARLRNFEYDEHAENKVNLNVSGNILQRKRKGRRRNIKVKQENELDATDEARQKKLQEIRNRRKQKKALKKLMREKERMNMRLNESHRLPRGHDFPRTPKRETIDKSEVPESVQMSIQQEAKKKRRNIKRRLKNRQNKSEAHSQSLQTM